jgi:glucose/arabinose dehydrogenase
MKKSIDHMKAPACKWHSILLAVSCWLLSGLAEQAVAEIDLRLNQVSRNPAVVDIQHAGDGSGRLFLVEQTGRIIILKDGEELDTPFMDIRDRVDAGGERGLLSLAFAPDFASSGYFYTWYTDKPGDTVLSRFRVGANPDMANPSTERILLTLRQPLPNHNGGRILFGIDGMLYVSTGDGGGGGDPSNRAQNLQLLLGKVLRLDVSPEHATYAIPPDNPFVGDSRALDEIWALGLRNPWRMSIDPSTGDIYIADVGQDALEEVNFQPADSSGGENYGWRVMEGTACYSERDCDQSGLVLPVAEYGRSDGCSISGGEVYRGHAYPALHGLYFYGDFCSGKIWGLSRNGGDWSDEILLDSDLSITTFGRGEDHSVYVASSGLGVYLLSDGEVRPETGFAINAGLNDAWFDKDTPGQGFFITVFPDTQMMFLAWFTYDLERPDDSVEAQLGEPGHRWLTAFGPYSGNRAVLEVEISSGGIFDASPPVVGQVPGGQVEIEFSGCNSALLTYGLSPPDVSGLIAIERLADDNLPLCEALR